MDKLNLKATSYNWFRENNIHISPISLYYNYFENIPNTKSINNRYIPASRKWIFSELKDEIANKSYAFRYIVSIKSD